MDNSHLRPNRLDLWAPDRHGATRFSMLEEMVAIGLAAIVLFLVLSLEAPPRRDGAGGANAVAPPAGTAGPRYFEAPPSGRMDAPAPRTDGVVRNPPPLPAARGVGGYLYVQCPVGAVPDTLNVSLVQGAGLATGLQGRPLRRLSPSAMAATPVEAGHYVAVISYRGQACRGIPVRVRENDTTMLECPREELAEIEYAAALAAAKKARTSDIPYFERVIALDPDHVNAHLQLAAYALVLKSTSEAQEHLAAVERTEPGNPYAARIRRLAGKPK